MGRAGSPAEDLFREVVAQAVTPLLKGVGFRKSGNNYHRRRGEVVQVVNIQVSHGSTSDQKVFYINNVGLAFDAICRLSEVEVLEHPKEYECDSRGTRDRLEGLVKGASSSVKLRAGEKIDAKVKAVRKWIEKLCAELDRIDGLSAY